MMSEAETDTWRKRVSYFYHPLIGNYYYGPGHLMKPHRMRMAHELILTYGLHNYLRVEQPVDATFMEMTQYHSDEYIKFLAEVSTNAEGIKSNLQKFNVGDDCPVFSGLIEFCAKSAGGSIGAAKHLNDNVADIAINWSGGLHHAKRWEASGFCYVNDIVLAILELLVRHQRVLYIDIDCHHGDGVEEAFYTTNRVLTLSFHKGGEFFPGTGDIRDIGVDDGKYYAINVPLREGITDQNYESVFCPIVQAVMERFQPNAVVMQCGADSLTGDRLGCFNLTIKGHGKCVRFVRRLGVPLLLLGGGGYTVRNVARCWAYETAVAVGKELCNELPFNFYYEYFYPEYTLHLPPGDLKDANGKEFLNDILTRVMKNIRMINGPPSVGIHRMPNTIMDELNELVQRNMGDRDELTADKRMPDHIARAQVAHPAEHFEDENESRGEVSAKPEV